MSPERLALFDDIHRMTFEDFIASENPDILAVTSNLITARLARDPTSRDAVEQGKALLQDQVYWFGITERFGDSMRLFRAYFEGCRPYEMRFLNRSAPYPRELSERGKRRLIDLNRKDQELYDFAFALFDRRHQEAST
jgi:hypothetical protein